MSSELAYEGSDEASESELLERSLSVWKGWNSIEWEEFAPTALDIHTASSIGHYEWVRSIILKGEDPALDRRNHGGWTPLMYACYIGHDNIVNLLITAGCSMNMKNSRGHTPLMLAASCGNDTVAHTLVRDAFRQSCLPAHNGTDVAVTPQKGAELELIDKTGWTALFHATYAGHQNFVAFLLEAGANKDAIEPSSGTTPFMEAAAEGHEIIVQLFLQHGVNVNVKAHNGGNARSLALLNGHMKVVSLIDNHLLPTSCLRSEAGLGCFFSSSDERQSRKQHNLQLKSQGPSIRDGPEAIARMIDRSRYTEPCPDLLVPNGYMSFQVNGEEKEDTKMSYRDVTSPINPEDYKDSSGSRATSDLDDFNDDSSAFTKTGAITIKSSSSSSGGLLAALGLSHEGSIDSDDSHSLDQAAASSDDFPHVKHKGKENGIDMLKRNESQKCGSEEGRSSPFTKDRINEANETSKKSYNSSQNKDVSVEPGNDASLLRNYFSADVSFPVGTASAESIEATSKQAWQIHAELSPSSNVALPAGNMTQVEIVNRFLKNLTMNNPETSTGQNRWAEETDAEYTKDNSLDSVPLFQQQLEDHASHALTSDNITPSFRSPFSSAHYSNKDEAFTPKDIQLNQESKACMAKKDDTSFTNLDNLSGLLNNNIISTGDRSHPFIQHDFKDHPRDLLMNQQWIHHPQVNYHHPLHNRHHHNPHPHHPNGPDGNKNTPPNFGNALIPPHPPNVTYTETPDPLSSHNLLHEYFYSDIKPSSHFQQYVSQTAPNSGHGVTINPSQMNYSAKLANAPYPSPHLIKMDLSNNNESPVGMGLPQFSGQVCQVEAEPLIFSQNADQTSLKPIDCLFAQQLLSTPSSATLTGKHQPLSRPQPHNLPQQASIIIPGHATSQPVCNTIGWDSVGLPENTGPRDLAEMLSHLGLTKYLDKFAEQDVDLQVFLSLTDNDLKELGVKLFGPRKKMTNAIARWHSNAPISSSNLEQAYADKLEAEMQEMAIQLNQAYENEERLKAQVLQEQQLRSVTESCLMEERASWEQSRQILIKSRSKLRTMADLMSRLSLFQKELKKCYEGAFNHVLETSLSESKQSIVTPVTEANQTDPHSNESCATSEAVKKSGNRSVKGSELCKRSEKCLKEMQQILTSLVLSAEHLLKSTQNLSNVDKNET